MREPPLTCTSMNPMPFYLRFYGQSGTVGDSARQACCVPVVYRYAGHASTSVTQPPRPSTVATSAASDTAVWSPIT